MDSESVVCCHETARSSKMCRILNFDLYSENVSMITADNPEPCPALFI